jgi:hypothetical protein
MLKHYSSISHSYDNEHFSFSISCLLTLPPSYRMPHKLRSCILYSQTTLRKPHKKRPLGETRNRCMDNIMENYGDICNQIRFCVHTVVTFGWLCRILRSSRGTSCQCGRHPWAYCFYLNINNINTWALRALLVLAKLTQGFVICSSGLEVLIAECLVEK